MRWEDKKHKHAKTCKYYKDKMEHCTCPMNERDFTETPIDAYEEMNRTHGRFGRGLQGKP